MGKVKAALLEDMMNNPDQYRDYEDYEFWLQCRKEELLEKEYKRIFHSKITKNRS